MTQEQILQAAFDEEFSAAAIVDTREIPFDSSFRVYCEENLCGKYGVNYSCPPDCGSPKEMEEKLTCYPHALVLQTIWEISDFSDTDAIKKAKSGHNSASIRLAKKLRSQGHEGIIVGASGCSLCNPCAITEGEPCRFPDIQYSCMSAYCIFVRKLAERCQMEYTCQDGLLAFFGMYVFR